MNNQKALFYHYVSLHTPFFAVALNATYFLAK
nr:MAG TPA: hypothetical protein [Caudoviricetes sp.]